MDGIKLAVFLCLVGFASAAEEVDKEKKRDNRDVGALLGPKFNKGSFDRGYLPPTKYYPSGTGFGQVCECRSSYPTSGGSYPGIYPGVPGPTYGVPTGGIGGGSVSVGFDDTVQVYPRPGPAIRPNLIPSGPAFGPSATYGVPSGPSYSSKGSFGYSGSFGTDVRPNFAPLPGKVVPGILPGNVGPAGTAIGIASSYTTSHSAPIVGGRDGYSYDRPAIPFP